MVKIVLPLLLILIYAVFTFSNFYRYLQAIHTANFVQSKFVLAKKDIKSIDDISLKPWELRFFGVPSIHTDPWGNPYQYIYPYIMRGTEIWRYYSLGADGKPGGEGLNEEISIHSNSFW